MGIQGVGNALSGSVASGEGGGGNSAASGGTGTALLKKASLPANMALQLIQSAAQSTSSAKHIDVYA